MRATTKLKEAIKRQPHLFAVAKAAHRVVREPRAAARHYANRAKMQRDLRRVLRAYRSLAFAGVAANVHRAPDTHMAVVLHLYYPEAWELFAAKLRLLKAYPFDLFVTLPVAHRDFAATIKRDFPAAYVFVVPNRGRDVLPFIEVAKVLEKAGYTYLLKMHSKKSTHRTDGGDWLSDLAGKLVPENPAVLDSVIAALKKPKTGIIGPEEHYLSLPVNFEANQGHMHEILSKVYSPGTSLKVLGSRTDYGFFAGTMFWARLDALAPILHQNYGPRQFEGEAGQIDGTFAHALERVFCLSAEIDRKDLYEVNQTALAKLKTYQTDNIPDWSDVYIGPKE
ncbi:MAG TPA: rhamnan synthesis F family protein [Candidatus Saccharimonadales bacterium]|nr:rhamnan synthesis F family protein [Candidatus Saccharimonadales bacterium]